MMINIFIVKSPEGILIVALKVAVKKTLFCHAIMKTNGLCKAMLLKSFVTIILGW
jgi:hypothetical protein